MRLQDVILLRLNNSLLNISISLKKQILASIKQHEIVFANSIVYEDDILTLTYDDITLKYKFHWDFKVNEYHLYEIEPLMAE